MKAIKIKNTIIPLAMLQEWVLAHIEGAQLIDYDTETPKQQEQVKPVHVQIPVTKRIQKTQPPADDEF